MWNNEKQQKIVSFMSNLQSYYHFKLIIPAGCQWFEFHWGLVRMYAMAVDCVIIG